MHTHRHTFSLTAIWVIKEAWDGTTHCILTLSLFQTPNAQIEYSLVDTQSSYSRFFQIDTFGNISRRTSYPTFANTNQDYPLSVSQQCLVTLVLKGIRGMLVEGREGLWKPAILLKSLLQFPWQDPFHMCCILGCLLEFVQLSASAVCFLSHWSCLYVCLCLLSGSAAVYVLIPVLITVILDFDWSLMTKPSVY